MRLPKPHYLAAGTFLAIGVVGAVLPYEPGGDAISAAHALPSVAHPLGTDRLGRDLLFRLVIGTRGFFLPGLLAMGLAFSLGTGLGAIAGYTPSGAGVASARGWRSGAWRLGRWGIALLLAVPGALPRFVSILLVCSTFGFSPAILGAAIGTLYAAELGMDVRRRVGLCCGEEYVESARAEGISDARILGYHILWLHCRSLIARHLVYVWSFCILVETSLSFLPGEFGVQEPNPSWGNMLAGDLDAAMSGKLWAALVPTVAILATVALLAYSSDRLDEFDSKAEELAA